MANFLDNNGLSYFWTQLKAKFATKVDKEEGKGLSTNDYTTEEKTKVEGIETGAEVNIIEAIQVNGAAVEVSEKAVNITVPTTVAALTDAGDYALKSDITNVYKYKGSKATVEELPASGNEVGDVYNVEADGMNYAWEGTKWDAMGSVLEITAISNGEIDTILAS